MALQIVVHGFEEGGSIPTQHTCDGENCSPRLEWSGAPEGTKSFALILDDPDAPRGTWTHWLVWDLPPGLSGLPERFRPAKAGLSGANDFGFAGYGGPCPPRGDGPHRYFFRLYALRCESLGLFSGATRREVDRALQGQSLEEAVFTGRYERN